MELLVETSAEEKGKGDNFSENPQIFAAKFLGEI